MKKINSFLVIVTLFMSSVFTVATAKDNGIHAGKFTDIKSLTLPNINNIDIAEAQVNSKLSRISLAQDSIGTNVQAPAPAGIQFYQVIAVSSSFVPTWESITPSQNYTAYDHGGSQINVAVMQLGFGNNLGATIDGIVGVHIARQNLCGASVATLHVCIPGEQVVGFIDVFNFSGPQGGYYSSSAMSAGSPYGHWTDSIMIL